MMPMSDEAMRNGWMPRSNSRVMVPGASLVCSVQEQMSGLRRFERDVGRFLVANFAHENHVRILPQDRSQPAGKCDPGARVDLHLVHARNLELDWVLERDDVVGRRLDEIER